MLGWFGSKSQKRIKAWEKEHERMLDLAKKVETAFRSGELQKAKAALKKLESAALRHLMDEDVAFYRMSEEDREGEMAEIITAFRKSFGSSKQALMGFLVAYAKDETPLDDAFIEKFREVAKILADRIAFEEGHFYPIMAKM
jgi:iron-sulfur cluster repair protein YtfE (RIC family)